MWKNINIDILGDISLWEYSLTESEQKNVVNKINSSLGSADYRIANLESPVVKPSRNKIAKSGPNLKADLWALDFLRCINIDAYTLANNHIGDYGIEGIHDTKEFLNEIGREYIGTECYDTVIAQEYPVLRKEWDVKVSFISICENEFGVSRSTVEGACGFDFRRIKITIETEKKWADYIIIIFHGGIENYSFPSPLQKQRYRTLIDQGAHAVIGMHSHCPVGYEIYCGAPIVYGTGNFYFPKRYPSLYQSWNYGYVVRLNLAQNENISIQILPYKTSFDGREFCLMEELWMQEYIKKLCDSIRDDQEIARLFHAWVMMRGKAIANALTADYSSCGLQEFCPIKNLFSCEAHNEVLKAYLNIMYAQKCHSEYYADHLYQEQECIIKKYISIDRLHTAQESKSEIKQILWGFSDTAQAEYEKLIKSGHDEQEILIVDKDSFKQGLYYRENMIISPQNAMKIYPNAVWRICTPQKYFDEIHGLLLKNGISEKNINAVKG